MKQQASWYMDKRIVYAQIEGEILTRQRLNALDAALAPFLGHSALSDVHVVIDASRVKTIHPDVLSTRLSWISDAQLGWNVLIAPDALANDLEPLLTPVNGEFCSFTSLEEGLFFLEDEDETLLMSI